MIKLKGDGESMAQRVMNKALGGGRSGPAEPVVDKRGGRGTIEPSQTARSMGFPSAQKQQKDGLNKDWSASSSRINMGAPVYMKSKTSVDAEFEDRGYVERKSALGDPLAVGALGSALDNLSDDSDDDEFGDGDSGALAQWRAQRMAELKKTTGRQQEFMAMGHGGYDEVTQDDFLPAVTKSKYVVCHFYHPEFQSCKVVDKHLSLLARKHLATRWIKIDATKSPFFVGKLQVKMLPTVVFFKDGIARDRLVGLDELGASPDFSTEQLEKRIEKAGVIITGDKIDEDELEARKRTANSIRQSNHNKDMDSEEEDDD